MKRWMIGLALILLPALCYGQPSSYASLYCINPSGKIIPLLQAGTPSPTNPPGLLAYGMNSSNQAVPLECDASGNIIASNLGGIPFVNTPTPVTSDVICYDGVQYTPCPPTAGPSQILYTNNTASDISTYDVWDTVPFATPFTIAASIPNTTTKTLIEAFATASGYPDITVIPAGEWQSDAYVQVSAGGGTTTLNIDVYDRTSGGVETLLFSFANTTVSGNGTAVQHYTQDAVESAFAVASTDRLVVKYSMTRTGSAAITGTLYGGGSTNYSHIHTPIGTGSIGGVTKTCSTLITAIAVTNGVVTSITCP